jgi:hypothetical protein
MMEFLGALVVIGIFVCWCDVTDAWTTVLRPVHALLPPYSPAPGQDRHRSSPLDRHNDATTTEATTAATSTIQ